MKPVNWTAVGIARWYDCKLGRMTDRALANLVGTTEESIRRRRVLLKIKAYSVDLAIEPFAHLFGIKSDQFIANQCGVSVRSVRTYRNARGIDRKPTAAELCPIAPPDRPYQAALGLVPDFEIATAWGLDVEEVEQVRVDLGLPAAPPLPATPAPVAIEDFHGPGLGYESLLGTMSDAKISREAGVPVAIIEDRRQFLGIEPYQRVSRAERFVHLFGVIPNNVLSKLAGVSGARIRMLRKARGN
ncbi:hypothetical protein [Pseudomonas asiatica]|uniref:hypothetical protein n=1 Tax=Pseudomonas asiatica TaxID=2219225 RepID=UPI002016480F|nr:hypothetical protein [Pseudomonas asiatica]